MHKKALFTTIGIIAAIIFIIAIAFVIVTRLQNKKEAVEQQREIERIVEVVNEDANETINDGIIYNADGTIDTSNWKTYRNEEYGFEVKYPEGWGVSEVVDGQMIIKKNISDCDLVPTGCPIAVLYDKRDFNSDYVSIDIVQGYAENLSKTSQWEGVESMLGGCHIKAIKNFGKNNSISFFSFYGAKNLNDEKQITADRSMCQSNLLNPYFNEIVKSFKET